MSVCGPYTSKHTFLKKTTNTSHASPTLTYLGTQLGEERSTSQVAYRFMWTGRLEVMLTGLEGCGEGTPPVRWSPPRSDILEAEKGTALTKAERKRGGNYSKQSSPFLRDCVVGPSSFHPPFGAKRVKGKLSWSALVKREAVETFSWFGEVVPKIHTGR